MNLDSYFDSVQPLLPGLVALFIAAQGSNQLYRLLLFSGLRALKRV